MQLLWPRVSQIWAVRGLASCQLNSIIKMHTLPCWCWCCTHTSGEGGPKGWWSLHPWPRRPYGLPARWCCTWHKSYFSDRALVLISQSGESHRPLTPIFLKSIAIHLPFLSRYCHKSMPSRWQKVVYTPPICIAIRLPFVSRCFCRSIRVRGRCGLEHPQVKAISEAPKLSAPRSQRYSCECECEFWRAPKIH